MWEPSESDIKWLRNVFSMVKDGGVWVVPKTNQLFIKNGNALVYRKKNTECMVEQELERMERRAHEPVAFRSNPEIGKLQAALATLGDDVPAAVREPIVVGGGPVE